MFCLFHFRALFDAARWLLGKDTRTALRPTVTVKLLEDAHLGQHRHTAWGRRQGRSPLSGQGRTPSLAVSRTKCHSPSAKQKRIATPSRCPQKHVGFCCFLQLDLCDILGLSWAYVGPSWTYLGPILAHLGPILAPSWPILAPSWPYLGPSWPVLALSWPYLGPSWPFLAQSWAHVGPSWPHLGPILAHLGPSWPYLGPILAHLGPSWSNLGHISVLAYSNNNNNKDKE